MKCTYCGVLIAEGVNFCPKCGSACSMEALNATVVDQKYMGNYAQQNYDQISEFTTREEQYPYLQASQQKIAYNMAPVKKKKKKGLIVGSCVGMGILVTVMVLFLTGVFDKKIAQPSAQSSVKASVQLYEKPIGDWIDGMYECDARKMDSALPDKVILYDMENKGLSEEEYYKQSEIDNAEVYEVMREDVESGNVLQYEYRDAKKLGEDDCLEYEEYLEGYYPYDFEVAEGYAVEVFFYVEGESESFFSVIYTYKVDGKWTVGIKDISKGLIGGNN